MPVRMVDDEELEDEFDDDSSNDEDYGYFIGNRVYAGLNSEDGVTLYKGPSEDYAVHSELSYDDLVEAEHYLGKGQRLEYTEDGVWLKLAYQKAVWVRVDNQDVDTD